MDYLFFAFVIALMMYFMLGIFALLTFKDEIFNKYKCKWLVFSFLFLMILLSLSGFAATILSVGGNNL